MCLRYFKRFSHIDSDYMRKLRQTRSCHSFMVHETAEGGSLKSKNSIVRNNTNSVLLDNRMDNNFYRNSFSINKFIRTNRFLCCLTGTQKNDFYRNRRSVSHSLNSANYNNQKRLKKKSAISKF